MVVEQGEARLVWTGGGGNVVMTWNGASVVPEGVGQLTTLSFIMCPLIADAIGETHWFPEEACPRPNFMGTVYVEGRAVMAVGEGPSWTRVVEAVRARMEVLGVTRNAAVASMDMRLHWPRRAQEDWVGFREPIYLQEWETSVWNTVEGFSSATIRARERLALAQTARGHADEGQRRLSEDDNWQWCVEEARWVPIYGTDEEEARQIDQMTLQTTYTAGEGLVDERMARRDVDVAGIERRVAEVDFGAIDFCRGFVTRRPGGAGFRF